MRYALAALLLLSSCGYRYSLDDPGERETSSDSISITVPYILGDADAVLNSELVYELSSSGAFRVNQSNGDLHLKVEIVSDSHERIGFRYDRDNTEAHLERNLLGVENRRTVVVSVSVLDGTSSRVLFGPEKAQVSVDYDYTDPGSPRDLLFASKEAIMPFSLGQLDSAEGAHDAAARPVFRKLSRRIVAGLLLKLPEIRKEYVL